jgi:DEAD/DEAH box helicase domain-containing protein
MSTRPARRADGIGAFADALASSRLLKDTVACRHHVAGSPARHAPPGRGLAAPVLRGLESWGVQKLYSHQAEALEAVRAGRNVVVVTPTASGKSLVYMTPTLEMCGADRGRALYLFPYKALAQDQARAFESLAFGSGMDPEPDAAIYDGDTPQSARKTIRSKPPRVLITNPDMLHLGILAHHHQWRRFLSNLRIVVVDELHVYRGIFGSHLHHVITRLRRICRHYGSDPLFVSCSATIGNPGEFAESLLGVPFTVVDRNGAPRAGRHFLFVNAGDSSPYTLATRLMAESIQAGLRTIAFTKARKITELIHSWLNEGYPEISRRVSAYRAGYLPEERRRIEERLADGRLMGVVSTSALEHGIDIGGLDVCILVGYPGSITSSWQRIGRVGRSDGALDQFFMSHPAEFFQRGFEPAAADPQNPVIGAQHLVCAAAEIPLTPSDRALYGEPVFGLVDGLTSGGALVAHHGEEAWYSLRRRPQRDVNLRSTGEPYLIVEEPQGRPVGSVGGARAFVECHEGAIYLHQGQQFEVIRLDRERHRVEVRRCDVAWYTQVLVRLGRVRVTQEFKQYARRRIADQARLSVHPLDLPPVIYETVGMWIEIPGPLGEEMTEQGFHFMGSLHASEHAAISLFPLLAICDRGDLGGISYPHHPQVGGPAVFIYDGYPGGIGLARKGFEGTRELVKRTAAQIGTCPCEEGCPSCIHSPRCGSGNHPMDKAGSLHLLRTLLEPAKRASRPVPAAIPVAPPPQALPPGPPPRAQPGGAGRPGILFFDVETLRSAEDVGGWDHIREMGLALAVVYDSRKEEFRTYREADAERLGSPPTWWSAST